MMRGGLISILYGKATEVPLTDVDTASSLTLMSADIERIVTGMETGHEVSRRFWILVNAFSVLWIKLQGVSNIVKVELRHVSGPLLLGAKCFEH
jgi:hypothetical protein